MEDKLFLVWFDDKLSEIMSIEKENSTQALEKQLAKEGIEIFEIYAPHFKAANVVFAENFEKMHKGANFLAPSFDTIQITDDSAPESQSPQSLDEVLDEIEQRKPVSKKLH